MIKKDIVKISLGFDVNIDDIVKMSDIAYTDIIFDSEEKYRAYNFIIELKSGVEIMFFVKSIENGMDFSIIQKKIENESEETKYAEIENGPSGLKNAYRMIYNQITKR